MFGHAAETACVHIQFRVEGEDAKRGDAGETGDDGGAGAGGRIGRARVCGVVDNAPDLQVSGGGGFEGEQGVVYCAERGPGDDDEGEAELEGEVGHGEIVADGDEEAADAFDDDPGVGRRESGEGVADGVEVDAAAFDPGGYVGGEGSGKADGVDVLDGVGDPGGFPQQASVGTGWAAGCDRFHHAGVEPPGAEGDGEAGGDGGFAHAGVGAGDEEAFGHGQEASVTVRMDSKVMSRSRWSSGSGMLNGGIRAMVLPRGRMSRPRFRASRQTRAPIRSFRG